MPILHYRYPDSRQTLREGIVELRAAEAPDEDAAQNLAPELADDIDAHDAIHVLFGCSTDLSGEIIAHVWTAFGTTLSMHDMRRVNMHDDHRQVLDQIGHRRLLGTWARSIPGFAGTLVRALRMKRRWPAESFEQFLDRRLCDLREEFGVRLPNPTPAPSNRGGASLRAIRSS